MQKNKYNVSVNVFKTMIWWFLINGTVLISFMTTVAMCGINFEMVQNIGNSSSPVSRMIEIENGKDVSFSCKIVDSESANYFDNDVVWGRKAKGLRFNNALRSSTLSFTPATLKDQGIYFCASLKHSLYETIYIGVKPSDGINISSEARWKRENASEIPNNLFLKKQFCLTFIRGQKTFDSCGRFDYNSYHVSDQNNVVYRNTSKNRPLMSTNGSITIKSNAPDISRFLKKTVVEYETKHYGYETFSERLREYARVIAPLVAVTLIISTLLYYLMKKFYICATYRERNSKTEVACQHSTCGHQCMLAMKNTDGFNNPMFYKNSTPSQAYKNQMNQQGITFANQNDDTVIFLPFLFEAK